MVGRCIVIPSVAIVQTRLQIKMKDLLAASYRDIQTALSEIERLDLQKQSTFKIVIRKSEDGVVQVRCEGHIIKRTEKLPAKRNSSVSMFDISW